MTDQITYLHPCSLGEKLHMMLRFLFAMALAIPASASSPSSSCACGPWTLPLPGVGSITCPLVTDWGSTITKPDAIPFNDYHPNPQFARSNAAWMNLNGLWQFAPADGVGRAPPAPPFGTDLNATILVPFPPESCLSGVWVNHLGDDKIPNANNSWTFRLWYRRTFDLSWASGRTVLHFGAVDWEATVFLNGKMIGNHTGGYDAFSFDVTDNLKAKGNELLVFTYDPSDYGTQVFGKQRVSASLHPKGDTYTQSSGIWQTVWLENIAPSQAYISKLTMFANTTTLRLTVAANDNGTHAIKVEAKDGATTVATVDAQTGTTVEMAIPNPKLWSPDSPFLYDLDVTLDGDVVHSYFGMRTISLGKVKGVTRPLINGKFVFLAGWLDQSFWPDGLYSPPSYDAMVFDVQQVKEFGFNLVRLHQKVNPPRWYYEADRLGVVVMQDMVQHYGDVHKVKPSKELYFNDLQAMFEGLYNHPSIIQWELFNEGDMVRHFDTPSVMAWARTHDSTRLMDTDSGGPANELHIGDVNDVHNYPYPQNPPPSDTQYAMVGELGGMGAFDTSHTWRPKGCYAYKSYPNMTAFAQGYLGLCDMIMGQRLNMSASVYTQITDLELECDGLLNYDRTAKFSQQEFQAIKMANQALIKEEPDLLKTAYALLEEQQKGIVIV